MDGERWYRQIAYPCDCSGWAGHEETAQGVSKKKKPIQCRRTMRIKGYKAQKAQYRQKEAAKNQVGKISVLHKESGCFVGLGDADHRIDREAFHQPFELLGVDLLCFFGIARPAEMTAFHTLGQE